MAVYHITATTSRFVSNGNAFADHTAVADSLIIDDGAYLVENTSGSNAVDLDGQGAWTVNVNGSIVADEAYAIWLHAGIAGTSSITIGVSGEVGTYAQFDTSYAIYAESAVTIRNYGVILGSVRFFGGAVNTFVNTGRLEINFADDGSPYVIANNVAGGATVLTNTGYILGALNLSDGNDVVTNNGKIDGPISSLLGDGNNKYISTSAASHVSGIRAGAGNDVISTAGDVGSLDLGDGTNAVTILATGVASSITTGTGSDTIVNYGHITGDIDLGFGNNTFARAQTSFTAARVKTTSSTSL